MDIDDLSTLRPISDTHICEWYDRPLLFFGKTDSEAIYFAMIIREHDDNEVWLYARATEEYIKDIMSDRICLDEAFKNHADGYVLMVTIDAFSANVISVERINCRELTHDMLPYPNEYFNG